MNNVTQMVKKVRQAPWRVQRQWVGLFLLGLAAMTMVAAIYLNVTVRVAVAGRQIQELRIEIADVQRANADLETKLASLSSFASMQSRAEAMGFRLARPEEVTYVIVPGYVPSPVIQTNAPAEASTSTALPPEYTESLFDWVMRQFAPSTALGGQ